MGFDPTTAVEYKQNSGTIQTTSFDPSSAVEVPEIHNPTESGNPPQRPSFISKTLRTLTRGSVLDNIDEANYLIDNQDKISPPKQGEGMFDYMKRNQPILQQRENDIINQGVGKQLEGPINLAIAAGAVSNPIMTVGLLARFSILDHFLNGKMLVEKYAPNTLPEIKDIAEIGSYLLEGGIASGGYDMAKSYVKSRFLDQGVPPATTVTPEQLNNIKDSPNLLPTEKADLVNKLGINQDHINASISSNAPIKVPIDNVLDLTKQPYWDRAKDVFTQGDQNATEAQGGLQQGQGLEQGKEKSIQKRSNEKIGDASQGSQVDPQDVKDIQDLLNSSEGPQTIKDAEGNYSRLNSGWPTFLTNKGYTKADLNNIFEKHLAGKPLTEIQQSKFDNIMADYRTIKNRTPQESSKEEFISEWSDNPQYKLAVPPETPEMKMAKDYYGITQDIKEAGYLLPDGKMLDFTGRHQAVGY